jgi:hypothetical protein
LRFLPASSRPSPSYHPPQFDPKVRPQDQPWGDECDEVLRAAQLHAKKQPHTRPCHVPYKDIVVPPSPYEDKLQSQYLDKQYRQPQRNTTFFFAGALPELSQEGQWKKKPAHTGEEPWVQVGCRWRRSAVEGGGASIKTRVCWKPPAQWMWLQ